MERSPDGQKDPSFMTIEQALDFAVQNGNMDIREAEECLEAYQRTFHGQNINRNPPTSDGSPPR